MRQEFPCSASPFHSRLLAPGLQLLLARKISLDYSAAGREELPISWRFSSRHPPPPPIIPAPSPAPHPCGQPSACLDKLGREWLFRQSNRARVLWSNGRGSPGFPQNRGA